jgi:peptide/nickel transport system substrate-binding protein
MIIRKTSLVNQKLKTIVIGVVTIMALLTGGSVSAKNVISYGTLTGPKTMNPFVDLTGVYWDMYPFVYDRLLGEDPKDNSMTPVVASSIKRSMDGITYTIKMRNGLVFHDGKPVTIDDVVFSYNYIMKNKLGTLAQYVEPVKSVVKIDADTIELKTNKKYNPGWFKRQTLNSIPILPKHIWSKISKEEAVGELPLNKLIGSGPYTWAEFETDHFVRLKLTENGIKRYGSKIDEVLIKQYSNEGAMMQDFISGNLDFIHKTPATMFKKLMGMKNIALNKTPRRYYSEIIFNSWPKAYERGENKHPHPALKDKAVRYALDWVLDEKLAAKIVHGLAGVGGSHMLPDGYKDLCNKSLKPRGFNPEKAKKILKDAGYKDSDNDGILEDAKGLPLEFDVWLPAPSTHEKDVAEIWAKEAKKIGIKLNPSVMDFDTLWAKTSPNANFDISFWEWSGNDDPDFLFSVLTSGQFVKDGWSDSGFSNPTYDKLYEQQKMSNTDSERRLLLHEMQQILFEEAPYLVFAYYGPIGAMNTDLVKGDFRLANTRGGVLGGMFIMSLEKVK